MVLRTTDPDRFPDAYVERGNVAAQAMADHFRALAEVTETPGRHPAPTLPLGFVLPPIIPTQPVATEAELRQQFGLDQMTDTRTHAN